MCVCVCARACAYVCVFLRICLCVVRMRVRVHVRLCMCVWHMRSVCRPAAVSRAGNGNDASNMLIWILPLHNEAFMAKGE